MLKGIPAILPPELLMVAEMGHGDELTIGDGNFPATRLAAVSSAWTAMACPKSWTPS